MSYLNDQVLDNGLAYIDTNGSRVDICSQEPATYAEATTDALYSLGNETGINPDAPADRTPTGRMVNIPAITAGDVTETGTATHWALTDGTSVLIATYTLSASQGVTDGNTWTLTAFEICIPDPAA